MRKFKKKKEIKKKLLKLKEELKHPKNAWTPTVRQWLEGQVEALSWVLGEKKDD